MSSIRGLYDRTKKLRLFSTFDSLPEELLWELAAKIVQENIKKDTVLLRPYTKNETGYLIIKGQVEVEAEPDGTAHASKSSLKTLKTMCGPIKIKSIQSSASLRILRAGDSFGFDNNIKKGSSKVYVPSVFAKCKTNCTMYTLPLKDIAEVFGHSDSKTLDRLLDFNSKNVLIQVDHVKSLDQNLQRKRSFYKPMQRQHRNTPISSQKTETTFDSKYPRNKSCLQNYKEQAESKHKLQMRSNSKDNTVQQNVSCFVHNLIMKKIRREKQQSRRVFRRRNA